MDERDREHDRHDIWDTFGEAAEAVWRTMRQLIREGNRRVIAFRDRKGEVVVKLPLTVAALIALALLWWAWPALLLAAIVLFALRGSVVILRRERSES